MNSDAAEIRNLVSLESVFRFYGSHPSTHGQWDCPLGSNHNNGDQRGAVTLQNGRAKCRTGNCFGEKGMDLLDIVGLMEKISSLQDQRRRVCEIAGIDYNGVGGAAIAKALENTLPICTAKDDEDEPSGGSSPPLVFPVDAWRGSFNDYRLAMQGTSEAPDSAHFAAIWAVAAARLRRRVSIYYAFTHYPNVFLVNYGLTGDSKTSAGRQGLRLLPEDGGVKVLRGVGSPEALGDWMAQPEGGPYMAHLLFIEELATLLIRGGWQGSTLLSFLTETFDTPDIYEVPFRKNPVKVQEPTPTLLTGTTPVWFWKGMRELDIHGGFGNRLFFLTGAPKPPIPMPAQPNLIHLRNVKEALHRLVEIPQVELSLSSEAQVLWNGFYLAWKQTQPQWDQLTGAAVKRIPAYILKLAMVYACFEQTLPSSPKASWRQLSRSATTVPVAQSTSCNKTDNIRFKASAKNGCFMSWSMRTCPPGKFIAGSVADSPLRS